MFWDNQNQRETCHADHTKDSPLQVIVTFKTMLEVFYISVLNITVSEAEAFTRCLGFTSVLTQIDRFLCQRSLRICVSE